MLDLKNQISALNVFQLQEIQRHVNERMTTFGARPTPDYTAPGRAPSTFKRGDLVEFYSAKKHRHVRLIVDRINAKSLGGHEADNAVLQWRVAPSLCRLVGADKIVGKTATGSVMDGIVATIPAAMPTSHIPSSGGGAW